MGHSNLLPLGRAPPLPSKNRNRRNFKCPFFLLFFSVQPVNVCLEHSTVRGLPPLARQRAPRRAPIVQNEPKMKQASLSFESHIMSTARNRRKAPSSSKRDSSSKNCAAPRKAQSETRSLAPEGNPLLIIDRLVKETAKKSVKLFLKIGNQLTNIQN